ncbi:MAG: hypothetical protein KDA28_15940, partial [Phycisphaerales bacterium]|nr:hypothetical protein [Phycisphaerales bacterium]
LLAPPALAAEELTLERFFPDQSIFGPGASQTSFSFDGRYGAFLYRPREESRHGNDLWIHDTQTGRVMRMTGVSKMSRFQESTRAVREDRIRKWKKKYGTKKDEPKKEPDALSGDWDGRLSGEEGSSLPPPGVTIGFSMRLAEDGSVSGQFTSALSRADISRGRFDGEVFECELNDDESGLTAVLRATIASDTMRGTIRVDDIELKIEATRTGLDDAARSTGASNAGMMNLSDDEIADRVLEDDEEDRRAPRYRGISTYTWSPRTHELIFTAENDLFRLNVNSGEITRLTLTRETERNVQYLPDASGFTYQQDDVIMRVSFDSHLTIQLDPNLPAGESMSGYELSPDGRRLVILTGRGNSYWASGRQVSIVNYRSRFAEVRQYTRHMPDDPFPDFFYAVHVYDIGSPTEEQRTLRKVHEHRQSGPRDIMQVPTFSPDSNKVTFASYAQDTGHVNIYESVITTRKDKGKTVTEIGDARV